MQAWCNADTLLLETALEQGVSAEATLVVNDDHGALTTALIPSALWTDSALAALATAENLARNARPPVPVLWSTEAPGKALQLVIMRVPKQLAYFEYQLATLTAAMAEGGLLLCGGMDKHLSPQTAAVMEKYLGPVTRHPGKRKARLFSARRDRGPAVRPPAQAHYFCAALKADLVSRANVFSADALDQGSRFLIEQLHRISPGDSAADLACGNGVLGFCALQAGIAREVTLCDESAMAIASARDNAAALCLTGAVQFHHGDGLPGIEARFDRILCNPPFHLGHTVDDFAGRRLLAGCESHLRPNGELYLVANRHLAYGPLLRRHFPIVERLAEGRKFIVWAARRG